MKRQITPELPHTPAAKSRTRRLEQETLDSPAAQTGEKENIPVIQNSSLLTPKRQIISGITPLKVSSSHIRSTASQGFSSKSYTDTQLREAEDEVKGYCKENIVGIVDMAMPDNAIMREMAETIGVRITGAIEAYLETQSLGAGANSVDVEISVANKLGVDVKLLRKYTDCENSLQMMFDSFGPWMRSPESGKISRPGKGAILRERSMYQPIQQLLRFVATCVGVLCHNSPPLRLIMPFNKTDVGFADSDLNTRSDIILTGIRPENGASLSADLEERPSMIDCFAVVGVKTSKVHLLKARAQLFQYSKGIYAAQHNRRFLWGMTVCGTDMQVCVLGSNFALASENLDMMSYKGRRCLVQLAVNWSLCEDYRLGYDPTMVYNSKLQCWEIQSEQFDERNIGRPITYYTREMVVCAERLFGRHTRCFKATAKMPSALDPDSDLEPHEQIQCDILIKDAWPEATFHSEDDMRDEAKHLQKITHMLKDHQEFIGLYPQLHGGGRVRFVPKIADDVFVEDTTITMLGDGIWQQIKDSVALRVHKRICMRGIGEPLKYAKSIPELIIVFRDVMRCHQAILEHCSILHRDISPNNILVSRDNGIVRGMLIDFDHALDLSDPNCPRHTERTGTLPYMSVNNLEKSDMPQTALDDFESIIYILCHIATFGWNSETRSKQEDDRLISKWSHGSWSNIAREKRTNLESAVNFSQICREFNYNIPHWFMLRQLVEDLRAVLIDKHDDLKSIGAIIHEDIQEVTSYSSNVGPNSEEYTIIRHDPFKERAKHWREISQNMLNVLELKAEEAKMRLAS
ncbi:hypothetical protein H4S08_000457 [Coemansia sp. RSA 1365]|nr:hypothetical protein H4S08_000457 [Coemansia sp. RSA 1365]